MSDVLKVVVMHEDGQPFLVTDTGRPELNVIAPTLLRRILADDVKEYGQTIRKADKELVSQYIGQRVRVSATSGGISGSREGVVIGVEYEPQFKFIVRFKADEEKSLGFLPAQITLLTQ